MEKGRERGWGREEEVEVEGEGGEKRWWMRNGGSRGEEGEGREEED